MGLKTEYTGRTGLVSYINANKLMRCHKVNCVCKLGCRSNGIIDEALPSRI